jgi:hypothetical protein
MAQLAKDYGTSGSGVNFANQFTDRDLAGQQNATSALDIDNFRNLLQGAERTFRTDAAASNITGTGTGSGSSRGLIGKKKATATQSVSQNFGDLLEQSGGYRNMYSDKGVDKDLIRQVAAGARGFKDFESGENTTSNAIGQVYDINDQLYGMSGRALDKTKEAISKATGSKLIGDVTTSGLRLANKLALGAGKFMGGSSAKAQGKANSEAQANAIADLQNKINQKIQSTGLKNQLSVKQNNQQDMELFKLLGLLDTTNL